MINLSCTSLDYPNDLSSYYANFCDLPGFILLESSDTNRGTYDIMSAFPYDRLQLEGAGLTKEILVAAIRQKNPNFFNQGFSTGCDLPFQGGALGFFSYDLAHALEFGETNTLKAQTPLYDLPAVDLGFYDWAIVVSHATKTVQLVACNQQSETAALVNDMSNRWRSSIDSNPRSFRLKSNFEALISKEEYEAAFYAIQDDLHRGRCYQINYTQPFRAAYTGDSWGMYAAIRKVNPVPFAAFMKRDYADILSFSPERFILFDQGKLLTSPIKGTMPRSANFDEDENLKAQLLACPKNQAENVMIVDLLRNDFGKIAKAGSVKVPALCELQSFAAVHHLVSRIEADCVDSISAIEAFLSCFPGGSITGTPKREAMKVICERESFTRGLYCGSIGYISMHGRMDTNIAIRTLVAAGDTLHLAAGGALVIDSICDEEYAECLTKIAGILKGLG